MFFDNKMNYKQITPIKSLSKTRNSTKVFGHKVYNSTYFQTFMSLQTLSAKYDLKFDIHSTE